MHSLKKSLTSPLGLVAVALAAICIAVGTYAFTIATSNQSTGAFTVGSESTSITVQAIDDLGADALNVDWCKQPNILTPGFSWSCGLKVTNTKTSGPVSVSMAQTSFVDTDGKHLATKITAGLWDTAAVITPGHTCTSVVTSGGGAMVPTVALSPLPGVKFGDPTPGAQAGDYPIPALGVRYLCLQFTYTGVIFNASTGASFLLSADDQ